MIVIPACLKCEFLEPGMKCRFHPEKIPKEITLAHKQPKEACKDFKQKELKK